MSCDSGYLWVSEVEYKAPNMLFCTNDNGAPQKVYSRCDNQKSCSFSPDTNKFFGDPCWGSKKRFSATYICRGCSANQFFTAGTGCTDCPGTKVSEGGTATSCSPAPCQPGNYMDSGVCKPCSKRYWSAGDLVSSCTKCPEGKTVAAGEGRAEGDCVWECQCESINKFYECIDTTYDVETSSMTAMKPTDAGHIKVSAEGSPNKQSATMTVSEEVGESSSFSHTAGASVTVGTEFSAKIPLVGEATVTAELSASYEYSTGKERSVTKNMSAEFPCVASPGKTANCKALIFKFKARCPYTQTWQHKHIGPSCKCSTSGVFEEIAASSMELYVNEVDMDSVIGTGGMQNFQSTRKRKVVKL